jgi:hypothetical protein
VGNFERKDTPHPKPGVQGSKLKKQLVDGHIIQHGDDRRPSVVSLTKKSSTTEIPETLQRQHTGPKSSLKHPPVYNTPNSEESFIASGPAVQQKVGLLMRTWNLLKNTNPTANNPSKSLTNTGALLLCFENARTALQKLGKPTIFASIISLMPLD